MTGLWDSQWPFYFGGCHLELWQGPVPCKMQRIQVVDEHQAFNRGLAGAINTDWDLGSKGFDYSVVAVFGNQSSGKSTLLNRLFDTSFDVMNEGIRQQTTKGIWCSKAKDANILVLDVEGTDGRERGEDQDFERKSALFALAISQVVMINMFESSVGLYQAANMGLLKTVLEVNLQLFQSKKSQKTLIVFVLRDFTGMAQLDVLSNTLLADLSKIWSGLSKVLPSNDSLLAKN